ncbi:mycofactocin biosynthesis chaperone MftB [Streptomyces plumbiresistens]|uniref:Mycofactocin biosynthesis chaperone MftB n=1 Tax=Streptomyces plumbiresistens TaxID=511811 RepID=A0ABP7SBB5_9ACTN
MPSSASDESFDMDRAWTLHPQVAVRPESFGALLYHFGNRRLSFLKDRRLLAAVRLLGERSSATAACTSAGIGDDELTRYHHALATLATSHMIVQRTPDSQGGEA